MSKSEDVHHKATSLFRDNPGFRSLRICADLQDFRRYVQICTFSRSLQIYADWKKTDILRNTIKTPQLCQTKRILKMFKTEEKSVLCPNDETFFCSNMYRSVEITDLYRAKQ